MSLTPHGNFGRRNNIVDPIQTVNNAMSTMNSRMEAMQSEFAAEPAAFANISIDEKQTRDAYIYTAHLPGLREEELKVEVYGQNLKISGVRSIVEQQEDETGYRSMRSSSSSFSRQFNLPGNAAADQVTYGINNGVLTVTVPKAWR
ncbi:18.3 kDa class I heat shock protein-like [Corylus avellana]|uniref:18.3 kDa class I heat shock protein-like n=1 Tax=Corylus avellana TaxID=13451 RepID=UPI001E23E1F4|nr:18.3 kDa class I heat shock protein-like [Corylus avellana]